ncbi:MAG: hypothetical protein HC834_00560 [Rhodospirillales bacterium]|nr:hypothetical protein [Rhodospirillales bacterium]
MSTLTFAALAKFEALPTKIVSIEENEAFAEKTRHLLDRFHLATGSSLYLPPWSSKTWMAGAAILIDQPKTPLVGR